MARGRLTIGLAMLALLIPSVQTGATLRERAMEEARIQSQFTASLPSVRLLGLGGMGLAVADEASELNAYDFGGSVSGILEDADGWTIDSWLANGRRALESGPYKFEKTYGRGGTRIVRRSSDRALGFDFDLTSFEAPDEGRLDGKIAGPVVSGLLNQRVGPAVLGLALGLESEEERRDVNEFYAIQHEQERWVGQLAAHAVFLGFQFGAAWDFERGDVTGKSEDPSRFHQDDYIWSRPVDRFTFFWLLPDGGRLEGGAKISTMDRQGSELARISWSDRSPRNPSRSNYRTEAVTFFEEEADLLASSRWRLSLDRSTMLAVEGSYRDWEWMVEEGVNYKGSLRERDLQETALSGAAGLARGFFAGRLLATLEARATQFDAEWAVDGVAYEATGREVTAGVGLEYFAARTVVLRGAITAGSHDEDVDQPYTLVNQRQVSGGISWLPRGGTIQIHGALWYEQIAREEAAARDLEDGNGVGYALSLRLLP